MNAQARSNLLGPEFDAPMDRIVGIDPMNVRRAPPEGVEALAADLREHKQLHPLILRQRPDGNFSVLAGGRRWRALQWLEASTARARLCGAGDAEARALSLAENVQTESLHPLDEAEAFADLAERRAPARIAAQFGVSKRFVLGRIALGRLPARAKSDWRAGRFGLEAAEILTLARGAAAIEALLEAPHADSLLKAPRELKRRIAGEAVPETSPLARLVGAEAYVAAGGVVIDDLFADVALFADRALLERLARTRRQDEAARLCREEGWGRIVQDEDGVYRTAAHDFTGAERDRLDVIEDELAGAVPAEGDDADRLASERDDIERLAALRAIPQAARHRYGVAVELGDEGRLMVVRAILPAPAEAASVSQPEPAGGGLSSPSPPGEKLGDEEPGEPAEGGEASRPPTGEGDDAFAEAAAAATGRPAIARRYVSPDAPLPRDARRFVEMAANQAVADVADSIPALAIALAVASIAKAGKTLGPVGLTRWKAARIPKNDLAVEIGHAVDFPGRLALAEKSSGLLLIDALAALAVAAIDLRGADEDDIAAVIAAAKAREPGIAARIAENLDYPAFFRAAPRAVSLRALRECGGEAMETGHAWRRDEDLAREASIVAKAKAWLPEGFR